MINKPFEFNYLQSILANIQRESVFVEQFLSKKNTNKNLMVIIQKMLILSKLMIKVTFHYGSVGWNFILLKTV